MVIIIGAGPAGLSLAYALSKAGEEVQIFEASPEVGGLSRSLSLWGRKVEIGPHYLVQDLTPRIQELLQYSMGDEYEVYHRHSHMVVQGLFFNYPPGILEILKKSGPFNSLVFVCSLLWEKLFPQAYRPNAESFMVSKMGKALYLRFFRTYNEKLWGVSCARISEEYAQTLIGLGKRGASFWKMLANNLRKKQARFRTCLYPHGGFGNLCKKLADALSHQGVRLHLSAAIQDIVVEGGKVRGIRLADGSFYPCESIFTTIPLLKLVTLLPNTPSSLFGKDKGMTFRNLTLVYLNVHIEGFPQDQCLYMASPEIKAARITNFNHFTTNVYPTTILLLEYWTGDEEALWHYKEKELLDQAKKDIQTAELCTHIEILDCHVLKIQRAFPVPDTSFPAARKVVTDYLATVQELYLVGRNNSGVFNFGVENTFEECFRQAEDYLGRRPKPKAPTLSSLTSIIS